MSGRYSPFWEMVHDGTTWFVPMEIALRNEQSFPIVAPGDIVL